MGFLFSKAKDKISMPKLPDAPAVPSQSALDAKARAKMLKRQRSASGQSTLLTPAAGLATQADTQSKSLLGV